MLRAELAAKRTGLAVVAPRPSRCPPPGGGASVPGRPAPGRRRGGTGGARRAGPRWDRVAATVAGLGPTTIRRPRGRSSDWGPGQRRPAAAGDTIAGRIGTPQRPAGEPGSRYSDPRPRGRHGPSTTGARWHCIRPKRPFRASPVAMPSPCSYGYPRGKREPQHDRRGRRWISRPNGSNRDPYPCRDSHHNVRAGRAGLLRPKDAVVAPGPTEGQRREGRGPRLSWWSLRPPSQVSLGLPPWSDGVYACASNARRPCRRRSRGRPTDQEDGASRVGTLPWTKSPMPRAKK